MSYAHERINTFHVDGLTVVLVSLMALFQGAALYVARQVLDILARVDQQPTQTADITIGLEIIFIACIEIGVILFVWQAYKWLPDRWQWVVKTGAKVLLWGTLALLAFWLWSATGYGIEPLVAGFAAVAAKWFTNLSGLKWIGFNVLALGLGVVMTVAGSLAVAPVVAIVLMLFFTVYDHLAVNLSDVMGELVEMSSSVGIPNFVVVPKTLRFDLAAVKDALKDDAEKPDNLAFLIGIGDFVFPTVLVVSAYVVQDGLSLPVLGAIAGTIVAMIVLRDSLERADGGLPALPWLNTGAIGGFVVGIVVSGVPFMTALGL